MKEKTNGLTAKIRMALNHHTLAVALKFSTVAAVVIALYFQDLNMVFTGAISNEATYHILAIPFIFAYLLYRKRKMVRATLQPPTPTLTNVFQKYSSTLIGTVLCAVAILAYWYGSYTFTPLEYHMLTLPLLAAGLILILFNPQTLRQLLFPIVFLFFLTPPPEEILYGLGSALANLSAQVSNSLANIFGLHATLSQSNAGPVITLLKPNNATLPFNVNVACSGIYSIIGFVIFAVFIAYITRGKLLNKVAIPIMGIPLIMALNIVRITALLGIGYNYGEDLAFTFFHTIGSSVLMFIGVLVLLAVTEKVFKKPKSTPTCPTCNPPNKPAEPFCPNCGKLLKHKKIKLDKTDLAKIASIILLTIMLLSIQAPVFALTQGPAQVITQTPTGTQINTTNSMFPNIQGYTLKYDYQDTTFQQQSGDDAALVYSYRASNTSNSVVWVEVQISSSTTSEHRWETCLINYPLSQGNDASVNQLDLRDIQLQDNPPMTARYFAFQYKSTNQTQVVLYWYQTATFNTNNTAQSKSVMISLIMYPTSTKDVAAAENQELSVAQNINSYWQPIQTWSPVALAISQNGLTLSAAASAILITLILYNIVLSRQEKKSLLTLFNKLPKRNQLLIKAVENAKKQDQPTTDGIANELKKLTNIPIDKEQLKSELQEAEKVGLIEHALVNKEDKPALAWKSLLPYFKS